MALAASHALPHHESYLTTKGSLETYEPQEALTVQGQPKAVNVSQHTGLSSETRTPRHRALLNRA
eukprot:12635258-Prorocentrum_lima.AAC.1